MYPRWFNLHATSLCRRHHPLPCSKRKTEEGLFCPTTSPLRQKEGQTPSLTSLTLGPPSLFVHLRFHLGSTPGDGVTHLPPHPPLIRCQESGQPLLPPHSPSIRHQRLNPSTPLVHLCFDTRRRGATPSTSISALGGGATLPLPWALHDESRQN